MAHEKNRNGEYYGVGRASGTARLDAAYDFQVVGLESNHLAEWFLEQRSPFNSLYYYGSDRLIHISYGRLHRWNIDLAKTGSKKGNG